MSLDFLAWIYLIGTGATFFLSLIGCDMYLSKAKVDWNHPNIYIGFLITIAGIWMAVRVVTG